MSVSTAVLLIASLIAVGSLSKVLAERLRLPLAIVHALIGIVIGLACIWAVRGAWPGGEGVVRWLSGMPLGSDFFIFALLPVLLFQSALSVDMYRIRQDVLPILMLAIFAVVVVTFAIGLALWPLADVSLAACLLLASIVATTDPVAVIAIFRSVGAPDHLLRLVEGESLFNDAAAIALFLAFLGMVTTPGATTISGALADFLILPAGGAVIGAAAAALVVAACHLLPEDRIAIASMSLALPYLAFVAAEWMGFSGVIAAVAAGVAFATLAPGRILGGAWRYLSDVWELLSDGAAVLVFILTSILVPRLLAEAQWSDLGLVAVAFLVGLAARAAVLLGLFPALGRFGRSLDVPLAHRVVAVWGGLRGSMTLVLALAVTEDAAIPHEVAVFVAVLATGFMLATLFVHGTTLGPLMRRLGLSDLSEIDARMRDLALASLSPDAAAGPAASADAPASPPAAPLAPETALGVALVAATAREREVVLAHFDAATVAPPVARRIVAATRRRLDLARVAGAEGYAQADAEETAFAWLDLLALTLQRRLGWSAALARRLAIRFQVLAETTSVVSGLPSFLKGELAPVLGNAAATQAHALIARRLEGLAREAEALRLQYPAYAAGVEAVMTRRTAIAREGARIAHIRRIGIIGGEVERALREDLARREADVRTLPALDLGLDARRLLDACTFTDMLSGPEKDWLAARLTPIFAIPGTRLIRAGEPGEAAYFISSGAVEIMRDHLPVRLGRGDVVGEMALVYKLPRGANVTTIAYCNLLRLDAADFHSVLARQPALRDRILAVAARRLEENRTIGPTAGG